MLGLYTGQRWDELLGLYNYNARWYDPGTGRFVSADQTIPQVANPQAYSRYTYVYNAPLVHLDSSGFTPYRIYARSFAPWPTFGFGFDGDNRGYSTDPNASAKVHYRSDFDSESSKSPATASWSSPSSHPLLGTDTETPSVDHEYHHYRRNGNVHVTAIGFHYSGSNPLAGRNPLNGELLAPPIDVWVNMTLIDDRDRNQLTVTMTVRGDNYPTFEMFLEDPSGQRVFLAVAPAQGGRDLGPFTDLPGDGADIVMVNAMQVVILTDDDGNFKNVVYNGRVYTIDEWNIYMRAHSLVHANGSNFHSNNVSDWGTTSCSLM